MVTVAFCKKLPQKNSSHSSIWKVYGMCTIITIVKADHCLMSQLLLNILSNVTLPPYPSFLYILNILLSPTLPKFLFFHNCHATPKGHGCHPPPPKKKILNVHLAFSHARCTLFYLQRKCRECKPLSPRLHGVQTKFWFHQAKFETESHFRESDRWVPNFRFYISLRSSAENSSTIRGAVPPI